MAVTLAKAGVQNLLNSLDSRFYGNDNNWAFGDLLPVLHI